MLRQLAKEFGYYNVLTNDSVYGKGAKKSTPEWRKLQNMQVEKHKLLWNLKPILEEKLKENEQYDLYKELELPLASILGTMESDGVKVDKQILVEMGQDLEGKLQAIEKDIYDFSWRRI